MTLPTSGPISLSDLRDEFGGLIPDGLTEYYRGGSYVPSAASTSIPTSGTISLSAFLGTSDEIPPPVEIGEDLLGFEASGSVPATGLGTVFDETYEFDALHQNATYEARWSITATATYGFTYAALDVWKNDEKLYEARLPGGGGAGWPFGDYFRSYTGTYSSPPSSSSVDNGKQSESSGHGDSLRIRLVVVTRDSNAYTPNHSAISCSLTRTA